MNVDDSMGELLGIYWQDMGYFMVSYGVFIVHILEKTYPVITELLSLSLSLSLSLYIYIYI